MTVLQYIGDSLTDTVEAYLKFAVDEGWFDCSVSHIRRPPLAVAQMEHPGVAAWRRRETFIIQSSLQEISNAFSRPTHGAISGLTAKDSVVRLHRNIILQLDEALPPPFHASEVKQKYGRSSV